MFTSLNLKVFIHRVDILVIHCYATVLIGCMELVHPLGALKMQVLENASTISSVVCGGYLAPR